MLKNYVNIHYSVRLYSVSFICHDRHFPRDISIHFAVLSLKTEILSLTCRMSDTSHFKCKVNDLLDRDLLESSNRHTLLLLSKPIFNFTKCPSQYFSFHAILFLPIIFLFIIISSGLKSINISQSVIFQ